MSDFKPLLASPADLDAIRYPVLASPKLDGIRALVRGGRLVSRKLLDIPNRHVQAAFAELDHGIDGELIDGPATDHDVYRRTNSLVMAHDKPQIGNLQLHVFDHFDWPGSYSSRLERLYECIEGHTAIVLVHQTLINGRAQLDDYEETMTTAGYEGIMLRDPEGRYKYGRSTAREGILLKVKRFTDNESKIIGFEEEMANNNEAERDNLGRTKRSTAKAGKTGKGTLGAFVVKDLHSGVEFNVGTGLTAAQRQQFWDQRDTLLGKIVKYKSFEVGVKVAPRHPVFIGFRSPIDM